MRHNVMVALKADDLSHLELLQTWLETNVPIRTFHTNKGYAVAYLRICGEQLVHDLAVYGIVRNKSRTLAPPCLTEANLVRWYIRGLFDGDGSLGFYTKKTPWRYQWTLETHLPWLHGLRM